VANVTSGQRILTTGRNAAARGLFDCIHQVVPTCTPSSTWFLGPTRVHIPNGIGLAVFAGLTTVTDRQTALLRL